MHYVRGNGRSFVIYGLIVRPAEHRSSGIYLFSFLQPSISCYNLHKPGPRSFPPARPASYRAGL